MKLANNRRTEIRRDYSAAISNPSAFSRFSIHAHEMVYLSMHEDEKTLHNDFL